MDFAKILSKIDSIQSTKQLNESAKPDFLDIDKDGDRKEPMKKAAADKKKRDVKEDAVNEVSAPGQEDWIKKNKQRFIDQYGKKKGMEVLYATAWKRSKKVDEARQLEECYGQAMQSMSNTMDDRSGMNVSSSMDTRTGSKTLTVSAEGDAADQLAQMLKLSGLVGGTASSQDVELEEYANEPAPQVQGIETQLQQGNDLNRPKKMTPHGYQNGDNPLAMDVREQEELSALTQALSEELAGIKVDKSKVPAYQRKQQGGDWKTTQQDLQRERERNISGAEGLAALKKKQGMSEAAKPDYIDLDKDGNRKESMKKAAADKKKRGMAEGLNEMDKTQTPPGRDGDIDWTKKQIHLGPEHTMKAKDVAKHALKILNKTMKKSHADTPKKKGVAEGKFVKAAGGVPSDRHGNPKIEKPPKDVSVVSLKQLEKNKRENPGQSPFRTQDEKAKKYLGLEEQGVAEGSAHGYNVANWYEKNGDQLKLTRWLRKEAGLPKDAPVYFDDADLVYGDKTIVPGALVNPKLKFNDLLTALTQATGGQGTQGVAEGFKNTYSVGDRVDGPMGTGTIVAVSQNVNVDGRVKVKLDDPSKAGEDGKYKDSFVLTTTQLKHISE